MKANSFRCLCALALILLIFAAPAFAQRLTLPLGSDWKFIRQDVALAAPTAGWENVTLPHTWNAQDGQLGKVGNPGVKDGYYRGVGWYARALDIPADWKNRRVFIRFQAASLVAKAYLNGQLLGEHRGGFTAFCYELTPWLHFGATNELRVQVDNSQNEDVPPISGDFNVNGGIYRPVDLMVTAPVCITPLDFASPGVYLTTKSLDATNAVVEIRSLISNGGDAPANVTVETEIADAAGNSVGKTSAGQIIDGRATKAVATVLNVPTPHLWNGRKDPYLYTATVRVIREQKLVDEISQPLGLRTLAISQDKGFLLNGNPYPIHGVNRHQDFRDKGWALSPADHERDAQIILDLGATAIRLAHYPQSEYFHDLCDRNGLLLWNEIPLVNSIGISGTPEFGANAERQLREMILQRYNHPAAAFWGLFNELDTNKSAAPDVLLAHLKRVIQELDSSRIDVAASDHSPRSYNAIPTAICFNIYPGWYGNGKPGDMAGIIEDRSQAVGKRIAISEYGGGANPAQHQEGAPQKVNPKGQFHPEEWQGYLHEREWRLMKDNPHLWGSFIWVMFDMPSASRNEGGQPGLNDKGLVTQDRKTKKDAYFFYKANWNPQPMVYVASRRATPRKLAATEVKAYSNCSEVELFVNGHSLGTMKPDEVKIARWPDVVLQPGTNHIEAVGFSQNEKLTDACEWVLTTNAPVPPR